MFDRKKIGKLTPVFLALIFIASSASVSAWAAEVSLEARVSKSRVAVGEEFTYYLRVSSSRLNFNADPVVPDFGEAFDMLGRYSDTQVSFVNGEVSSNNTLRITLMAQQSGRYTFDPPTIEVGGRTVAGNRVSVEVRGTGAAARQMPAPVPGTSQPKRSAGRDGDPILLFASVSTDTAFVGQQIIYDIEICQRVNVAPNYRLDLADLHGFVKVDLPTRTRSRNRTIGNRNYTCNEVSRYALFPTTTGAVKIEPTKFVYRIARSVGFFFDRSSSQARTAMSAGVGLQIKPLPSAGKPANTEIAVGRFNMRSTVDSKGAEDGEPITLDLEIFGAGNLIGLKAPQIIDNESFRVYEPKVTTNKSPTRGGLRGSKKFEYLIIPEVDGQHKLPRFKLNYFDPEAGRYNTLSAGGQTVKVKAAEGAGVDAGGVVHFEAMLRPVQLNAVFARKAEPRWRNRAFIAALIMPLFLAGLIFGVRRFITRTPAQETAWKASRAARVAVKKVKARARGEGDPGQRLADVDRAVRGYIEQRFDFMTGGLTSAELIRVLVDKRVSEAAARGLAELLQRIDGLRYTPDLGQHKEIDSLVPEVEQALKNVEADLK
jgi:BatD DUF11 like domain